MAANNHMWLMSTQNVAEQLNFSLNFNGFTFMFKNHVWLVVTVLYDTALKLHYRVDYIIKAFSRSCTGAR